MREIVSPVILPAFDTAESEGCIMWAGTPPGIDVAAEEAPQIRTPSAFIRLLGRVERSTGLDPVVRGAEPFAGRIVANEQLRRVLHGEATGIPLHIIYTDVPLGAWWMAQVLDLIPDDGARRAADAQTTKRGSRCTG